MNNNIRQLMEAYEALTKQILIDIQSTLNKRMKEINDAIYQGIKTVPTLTLSSASRYSFHTPQDRGIGSEYKGLIVFDLAMLEETSIPIIAHDSVLLKEIQDTALEGILTHYSKQEKQVFIALDKNGTYSSTSQALLKKPEVLRLSPDGGELYGWTWNNVLEDTV